MATGKQLAFMCGEVSPAVRYNSKEVSYATGLDVLTNGYVRKEGGVVNRQGGKILFNNGELSYNSYNSSIIDPLNPPIVVHTIWNPIKKKWTRFAFRKTLFSSSVPEMRTYLLEAEIDGGIFGPIEVYEEGEGVGDLKLIAPTSDLNEIKLIALGDKVLITPYVKYTRWFQHSGTWMLATYTAPNICYNFKTEEFEFFGLAKRPFSESGSGYVTSGTGPSTVYMPARYLITITDPTGYEYCLPVSSTTIEDVTAVDVSSNSTPKPWIPNASMMTTFKIILDALTPEAAQIYEECTVKLYRCSWVKGGPHPKGMPFTFVGSSPIRQTFPGYEAQITDYGISDPTIRPPSEIYGIPTSGETVGQLKTAAFFQQRLHAYADSLDPELFAPIPSEFPGSEGVKIDFPVVRIFQGEQQVLVSKLNVPHQLNQPLIYSRDSEAFSYAIAEARGKNPIHIIAAERVIHFMEDGIYAVLGNQSGSVTPTQVNPVKISSIGCSSRVSPAMAKGRIYFVDSTNRRLLVIEWAGDSEGYRSPKEVSTFSSHLLDGDEAVKIVALSDREETVFILTKEGKLIQITVHDTELTGWAAHDFTHPISEIALIKTKPNYEEDFERWRNHSSYKDALMVMGPEMNYLDVREDSDKHIINQTYLDGATYIGTANVWFRETMWRATLPLQTTTNYTGSGTNPDFPEPGKEVPRTVKTRVPGEQTELIYHSATPNYYLSLGDLGTTSWEPGDTIWIYTSNKIVTAGNTVGIDYNDPDNFRIDIPFTEETVGEDRRKIKVQRRVRLKVFLSTEEAVTGKYRIGYRYQAEIEDTTVPVNLRILYERLISGGVAGYPFIKYEELEKSITNWKISYKDFVFQLGEFDQIYRTDVSHLYNTLAWEQGSDPAIREFYISAVAEDGRILSSPDNPEYEDKVKMVRESYLDGATTKYRIRISLSDFVAGLWIGKPYEFNMTTLPIEASDNRTLLTGKTIVNEVGVALNNTRGGFVGLPDTPLEDMQPMSNLRNYNPYAFAQTPTSYSGFIQYSVPSEWADGRVTFKNVDPTPINVLAIFPRGESSAR